MYMITSATSEKNIGEVKTPAPSRAAGKTTSAANATATVMGVQKAQISELLSSLSLAQGKLPESLSAKQNTLIRYLSALDGGHAAELGKNTNPTAKQVGSLVSRLIGKFPDLNRQISDTLSRQGLSGKSGDALSAEISQNLANLPKIIQEGAPAGRALVEFFAQSAIARLDPKKLNQTLVKQMNNSGLSTVADTTPRQQREIAKVLDSTVSFIYRNQNRPAGTSVSATASGTAERSSAGGDFTDPTYRNPVQNRQTSTPQLSAGEQSALMDKVRNLLSGAAQTAISARLIEAPGPGAAGEDADVSEESLNKAEQMLRQFVKEHPGSSDRQPSDLSDALKQAAASRTGTTTLVDLASGKKTEQTAVDTGATRKTSGQTQETPGEQQTRITQEIARNFSIIHKSFNLDTIEKAVAAIRDLQKQQTLKAENQTVTEQSADETANPDDLKTVGKMMKSMLSSNNQETAKPSAESQQTVAAKTAVDPQNVPAKTAETESPQAAAKTTVDLQNAAAKTAAAETTTAAAKTTVDPQNAPAKTAAAETTTAAAKTTVDPQNAPAKTVAPETQQAAAKTTVDPQNAPAKTVATETPQAAAKTTVDPQNASAKTAAAETTTAAAKTTVDPQNAPAKTVAAETPQAAAKTTVDPQNAAAKTTAAETQQAAAKTTVDSQNAPAKTAAAETTASAAKTTVDSQNTAAKTASAVPQVKNNADPQKAGIREQAATEPKQTRSTAEMIYQQNKQSVTRTDETIRSKPEQPSAATARTADARAETPTGAEVEKRGLFRKIAGLFTRSESAAAARPADSPQQRPAVQLETPVTAKPVETGTASPVKTQITATGLNQIMQDFADPSIPDNMKRNARNIEQMFNASLADTPSLLQWLNYMDNPLSGNSSMSKGLRAWASMLVAVRLKQFGINVEEELRSPRGKMLKLLQDGADVGDSEQWPQKMLDNLTRHLDTLHNSAQQTRNEGNVWPFYLPLPTPKENRRENCMLLKRSKSEEGQDHGLDLNFYFEIAPFGSIGIKVNYNSPDLKLRATAESYDGYSRLRETLHLLQKRFSELGLNSSDFECRRGSVKHPSDYTDQELQFMQDDEFDGWRV